MGQQSKGQAWDSRARAKHGSAEQGPSMGQQSKGQGWDSRARAKHGSAEQGPSMGQQSKGQAWDSRARAKHGTAEQGPRNGPAEQGLEIANLSTSVSTLLLEVEGLKTCLSTLTTSDQVTPHQVVDDVPQKRSYTQAVSTDQIPTPRILRKLHPDPERKFNLIIHGLEESAQKLHFQQVEEENASVLRLMRQLSDDINPNSIRGCFSLGKFTANKKRPLLVKMSRACDVSMLLSKGAKLADLSPVKIRQDMSPSERKTRALLLKSHWELIGDRIEHKSIRISANSLIVNGVKYGQVVNGEFLKCDGVSNSVSNMTVALRYIIHTVPPPPSPTQSTPPTWSFTQACRHSIVLIRLNLFLLNQPQSNN